MENYHETWKQHAVWHYKAMQVLLLYDVGTYCFAFISHSTLFLFLHVIIHFYSTAVGEAGSEI